MLTFIQSRLGGLTIAASLGLACAAFGPAQAATITDGASFSSGLGLDLSSIRPCGNTGSLSTNLGTFSGAGPEGSGGSVCGDTSSEQVKDENSRNPFGRFNPRGGTWIDSNDLRRVNWDVSIGKPIRGVSFSLVDAHDQANSYFSIETEGASWSIPERLENGNLQWIRILFDEPVDSAEIVFRTRHNDGFGIADATVAPIPLPPAALLLGSGIGLMALMRRRRLRAA